MRTWLSAWTGLAIFVAACGPAQQIGTISAEDLHARTETADAPVVLDVRTREEFRTGHIPGAINVPHLELAARVGELDPRNDIVVHCVIGPRARLAEATLLEAGVPNVYHLEDGLAAWMERGFPLENETAR